MLGGSDGPGWVGGGWVGWGWPGFGGWVVGGTVAGGAVVVEFRTWPPSSAGSTNGSGGRSRVAQQRCQPLGRDVLGRRMAGTRGVLMPADHGRIDPHRPLRTLVQIASNPQPVQDHFPRTVP